MAGFNPEASFQGHSSPAHGSQPPTPISESSTRKRKRIPVACRACRNRKSRCDGERPRCSSCAALNVSCEYVCKPFSGHEPLPKQLECSLSSPLARHNAPDRYLNAVDARLAALEQEVRDLRQGALDCDRASGNTKTRRKDPHGRQNQALGPAGIMSTTTTVDDMHHDELSPDATDGTGTIEFTSEEDCAYFGASSNIAFIRSIRSSIAHSLGEQEYIEPKSHHPRAPNVRNSGRLRLSVSRPPSPVPSRTVPLNANATDRDTFWLPPEHEVLRLCRQYFSDTGMLFPYIHEASFWKYYEVVKTSHFKRIRASWLGLLNMVMAMATTTAWDDGTDGAEQSITSDMFFMRAKTLCLDPMRIGASLEVIQVLLLMTQYLQGTRRSIKTWIVHGLAVRTALQLGFHSNSALISCEPLEQDTRIRTWHACILLDRILSITLGRPPTIPECYVKVRLPRHTIVLANGETILWSNEENSTLFWNANLGLYQIAFKIIESLYENNLDIQSNSNASELASTILQIEQSLIDWKSALPKSLSLLDQHELLQDEELSSLKKLRAVLTLRYLNLQLLTHRPILQRQLQLQEGAQSQTPADKILIQLGCSNESMCFRSAEEIINIVSVIATSPARRNVLGAWWFSLYYTLNAALTIVAILLSPDGTGVKATTARVENGQSKEEQVLVQALECMPLINQTSRMTDKCEKFTSALLRCIRNLRQLEDHGGNGAPDVSIEQSSDESNGDEFSRCVPNPLVDFADVALDPFYDFTMVGFEPDVSDGLGHFTRTDW